MASKKNRSRKSLAVALAIVGVAGLSMASAAQLNITSDPVAAGVTTVGTCQGVPPVTVAYTTAFTSGVYNVTGVTVSAINAGCSGHNLELTLMSDPTTAIPGGTVAPTAITGVSQTFNLSGSGVSAASVTNIAVVIH